MKFTELEKKLGLTKEFTKTEQLALLAKWCLEHVSTDCRYSGKEEEQYSEYKLLAKAYLDDFLPHIPAELVQPVSQFGAMNVIQYAASMGYDHYLSSVTSKDAEPFNKGNTDGMTPLHLAASHGNLHTLEILFSRGAVANIANNSKQFPIYSSLGMPISHADNRKEINTRIFQLLKDKAPFAINAVDSSGENVVHAMAVDGYDGLIKDIAAERPQLAFQQNNFGRYPIHTAILSGQLGAVKELLKIKGMSEVQETEKKRNPLHYAAQQGDVEMIHACLQSNSEIDARDGSLMTALLIAAEVGNLPAVQALIEAEADASATDYRGYTLLHHAVLSDENDLVTWILNTTQVDINALDNKGRTALYCLQNKRGYEVDSPMEALLIGHGAINTQVNSMTQ